MSCASSHLARTSPNPGHVPTVPFLIAWVYEDSSRPGAQLTLRHITLPRNSLQALLPHHLHRPFLLQLRYTPLFVVLGHLDVSIHNCVYHRGVATRFFESCTQFLCPGPSLLGGRGWIVSCPVSSICAAVEYPWRSKVALCGGCYGVRSLALSL